ncbi:hypothetical protein GOBAR_DD06718 [Gossypium barbadense]|nr:hypothetical protein GOBAR_DD06718 [Gossypium barbadense]
MNLVLSTDAKPRLKWTPELHQRFVDAVNQLGGPDKATPKSVMRVMGIPGLTLNTGWGKALGIIQITKRCQSSNGNFIRDTSDGIHGHMNESLQIPQALQMQMEVQRHLQLRIEAQGKYLQTVLKKAQETLAGYSSSSAGAELARAELSQLVSMVNTGCTSSSFSELTEVGGSSIIERKPMRGTICSMGSSLTSSESSGRNDKAPLENGNICTQNVELSLMDFLPEKKPLISCASNQANGKKRSVSKVSDGVCVEQPLAKRLELPEEETGGCLRKSGFLELFDLNSQCHNDIESGPKAIDLNCRE